MANVITILNTIRANASSMYQERIPVATQSNLTSVGSALLEYEVVKNEFLAALIGKIAFQIVANRRYKNPLAILKKGAKPFGTDIEEIFTNPVTAEQFDGDSTDDLLTQKKPDIKTIYHRMNRQDKYKVSVSDAQLKTAFTSEAGLNQLINSIISALYSGDEMDEYLLMRNLITSAIAENKLKKLPISYSADETSCKQLVTLMRTISTNMTFQSKDYNGYNVLNASGISGGSITPCITWTPKENQVILIRSDVDAVTDVEVLAKAFNMDKTNFLNRKIVVDSFGDENTLAVICDEAMFKVYDDLYVLREFNNGSNLTYTKWLHHWQTMSLSLFANCVAIQSETDA